MGDDDEQLLHPSLDRQRAHVPRRQPRRAPARPGPRRRRHRHRHRRPGQRVLRRPRVAGEPRHRRSRTTTGTTGGRTRRRSRTRPSTGSGTRSTTARPRRRPTTRSSSRSTSRKSGRSSTRAPARPARRTPSAGSSGRTLSANAPLPLASDATCGQPRFDPVNRNLYYACNEGDHVRMTIGHVAPGQRTGIQFHNVTLPVSPGGGGPGHLFPALAIDRAATSTRPGSTRPTATSTTRTRPTRARAGARPVQVNSWPAVTNEFIWAQGARRDGRDRVVRHRRARASRTASRAGSTTRTARPPTSGGATWA